MRKQPTRVVDRHLQLAPLRMRRGKTRTLERTGHGKATGLAGPYPSREEARPPRRALGCRGAFPRQPPLRGAATGTWLEKNALLALRIHVRRGPPKSVSVLGADDANDSLCMLYTDDRGVTRRYEMTLTPRFWTLRRKAPGFSQRFLGRFDVRRRTIHGAGRHSTAGVGCMTST